jgi:hypothetical protein
MTPRRLTAVTALLLAAPLLVARADDPSHLSLPGEENFDLNSAIARRLLRGGLPKDPEQLQQLMKLLEKSGFAKDMVKNLDLNELAKSPALQDPRLRQQVADMLRGSIDGKEDPGKTIENLRNLIPKMPRPPDGDGKMPRPPIGDARPTPAEVPPVPPMPPDPTALTPPDPGQPPPPASPPPSDAGQDFRMQDWARRLERAVGPLDRSPALRDAIRDLSNFQFKGVDGSRLSSDTLTRQFERLGGYLDRTAGAWNRNVAPVGDLQLPKLGTGNVSAPSMPAPRVGGVGAPSGGGSWFPVIALAVIAIGAIVAWRFRGGRARERVGRGRDGLGPWPVDPSEVADARQLVEAFEYLSVLRCGDEARVWNHRVIAGALGVDAHPAPADRVAGLYERARYAPPAEPLTDADLRAARRDLSLLAGKSSA